MRKPGFILIALAFFAPMLSFGQYFQKLHDIDSSGDFGWNIFVQNDGDYFVTSGARSNTTFKSQQAWFNISQDGNIVSNTKIIASDGIWNFYQGLNPGEAKKLQGGGYLVPANIGFNGKSAIGLMKLNAQLDTEFVRFYTDTNVYREDVASCDVMPNGDFIIGGFSALNGTFMDSAIIIRTDPNGNMKWKRKYKKVANQEALILSLQALDANRILVGAASTYYVWVSQTDNYNHSSPWFMTIDSTGNIINDTLYGGVYGAGGRIYKDILGGYYNMGAFDSLYNSQNIQDLSNFPEYLMHLNENFEIDWVRNFGTLDGHKYIWRVEQLPDGNFQLSGANGVNGDPRLKGWAARVDHNGWTIWDNDYTCDTNWSSYLVDFDVQQDGSLVLVGAARNDTVPQWRGQELWLVSVDANGCLQPGCAPTVVKEEMVEKQAELLVYPNPTSGNFIVNCDAGSLSIMSIDGRTLKQYEVGDGKTTLVLPPGLAAGVYMLKYVAAGDNASSLTRLVYQP